MEENKQLEFKSEFSRTFLKTVSAFANYDGGEILFGVSDDGIPIGVKNVKETLHDIENSINDAIDPTPQYTLSAREQGAETIVSLQVLEGRDKPYYYKGSAYKRSLTSTVKVDRQELHRLVMEGQNLSFEEAVAKQQDLTFDRLGRELAEKKHIASVDSDILKTLEFYAADALYNNAAAIFADENAFAGIDMVQFGESINQFKYRETHEKTSILNQYDAAVLLYRMFYEMELVDGIERKTVQIVPENAFREAVANALAHRDWASSANVRISFFDDRIQVVSPGGLPKGITESEYLQGRVSVLRNPIVGDVLNRLKYIERFGTGVPRIKEAYRDSLLSPSFDVEENSISVTLPVLGEEADLNEDEKLVLGLVKERGTITRRIAESDLELSPGKTSRALRSLVDKKLLRIEGAARSTRYTLP